MSGQSGKCKGVIVGGRGVSVGKERERESKNRGEKGGLRRCEWGDRKDSRV